MVNARPRGWIDARVRLELSEARQGASLTWGEAGPHIGDADNSGKFRGRK